MANTYTNIAASMVFGLALTAAASAQEITVAPETANDQPMVFNIAELEAMPQTSFKTSTIWTEGVQEFTGVALSEFLDATDATAEQIRIVALNDYAIEVPVSDAVADGPIIAYRLNGEPMSVRDKGPFWLVYPFDAKAEYRSETIYSRSIWQIDRIEVH